MIDLLKKYPEAAEVVRTYYLELMLDALNTEDLPDNFKEYVREKGLKNEDIVKMLEASPRSMFDVFDDHDLYIQVTGDNTQGWYWEVEGSVDNPKCETRKDAEKNAVEESFRILNEQICQTKS